jgi:hypothetical protein
MDQLVDLAGGTGPVDDRSPTDERGPLDSPSTDAVSTDGAVTDPPSTDDVESELNCSAREAGWGYAGVGAFGPAPDDGFD